MPRTLGALSYKCLTRWTDMSPPCPAWRQGCCSCSTARPGRPCFSGVSPGSVPHRSRPAALGDGGRPAAALPAKAWYNPACKPRCCTTAFFLVFASDTLIFTKQSLTCPKSSAFFPAKAPGVSTKVMMGNPNLSACFMKRRALRYPLGWGMPKLR